MLDKNGIAYRRYDHCFTSIDDVAKAQRLMKPAAADLVAPSAGTYPAEDTEHLVVPSICILEVFTRMLQQRGEQEALQAAALMRQGTVHDLTIETALGAARIGAALRLPLADSVALLTAQKHRAVLWTQDADFEGIENVKYFGKKKG